MGQEWLLDIRFKENYAAGHIPASINIPLGPSFISWAERLIPHDVALVIIHDDDLTPDTAKPYLATLLNERRYLNIKEAKELTTLETITIDQLAASGSYYVIDVRSEQEWESGHIKEAHHIPLQEVEERISQIPKSKQVALICGSGYRSAIFASFLQRAGYTKVANVLGGMRAWMERDLPVI